MPRLFGVVDQHRVQFIEWKTRDVYYSTGCEFERLSVVVRL